MPCFGFSLKALFILLTPGSFVLGDLPVHCAQPQSLGVWRFHVGSYGGDSLCGYQTPDEQDGHHDLTPPVRDPSKKERGSYWLSDKFKESYAVDVVLRDWSSEVLSVEGEGKEYFPGTLPSGEWTLVYDEGFHVAMKGQDPNIEHSFFSFYKFMLNEGDNPGSTDNFGNRKNSYCDHTLLGWYKRMNPATGAMQSQECFWGERINTLEEAIANQKIPPPVAPVMPLPLNSGHAKGAVDAASESRTQPDSGPGGFRGSAGGPTPTAANKQAEPEQTGKKTVMTVTLRIVLQIIMGISVIIAAMGMWAGTYHKDNPSTFASNAWRVAILCSMVVAAISFAILWTHRGNQTVATTPPGAPVGPTAEKTTGGMTIKEWATKMDAEVQAAKVSGKPVRWTSDPDKLKLWLDERREKHGIEISEDSEVVKLLDLISPQLSHQIPGFGSNEVIGPQRAAAIQEQREVAQKLGKDLGDLTNEDLSAARNTSQSTTNHHNDKSFTMGTKVLDADGWKTLADFDWRQVSLKMSDSETITDFVNDVPDQGGCGSCYAVAATSMFTSRAMLKYPELHEKFASKKGAERLSVEQQMMCNQYNQACGGGYPYLVAKWGFENELKTQKCVESTVGQSSGSCPSSWTGDGCEDTFRIATWRYVGGALGRCGLHHLCEAAMREELYKGGPMAVSVEPTGGFGYSDGVYHGVPGITENGLLYEVHTTKDIPDCQDAECYIWRKVDHSVLLVGWGEDLSGSGKTCQARYPKIAETEQYDDPGCTAIKNEAACGQQKGCVWQGFLFWTIQNSYGKSFGKEGYLSFGPRGADPMRIESMVMAASVEWVKQSKPVNRKPAVAESLAATISHQKISVHTK